MDVCCHLLIQNRMTTNASKKCIEISHDDAKFTPFFGFSTLNACSSMVMFQYCAYCAQVRFVSRHLSSRVRITTMPLKCCNCHSVAWVAWRVPLIFHHETARFEVKTCKSRVFEMQQLPKVLSRPRFAFGMYKDSLVHASRQAYCPLYKN